MAQFGGSQRGIQQPQALPVLNTNHALAKGLAFSCYNSGAEAGFVPYDAVSKTFLTKVGTSLSPSQPAGSPPLLSSSFAGGSDAVTSTLNMSAFSKATFSFWLYRDTTNDLIDFAFGAGFPNNKGIELLSRYSGTTSPLIQVAQPTSVFRNFQCGSGYPAAGWNHFVIAVDFSIGGGGQLLYLFKNGVPQLVGAPINTSGTWTSTTLPNDTLWLMRGASGSNAIGRISSFHVYNRTLAGGEAQSLHANTWQMFGRSRPRPLFSALSTAPTAAAASRWFFGA